MGTPVIIDAVRTPLGKRKGWLAGVHPAQLLGFVQREVLSRAGATTVNLTGSEIFTSLQTGVIDATDWVRPYNDLAFGLHKAARFYYYPGWQEPCAVLELTINKQKLAEPL